MFGLVVLIVMVLYLWLLVWATKRGWRWGIEKQGWTGGKRWRGAAIGFLLVYLPVFWDFIPTVAVYQFYCAKDAGFWVYKTLDQWKAENPGVMETLVENKIIRTRRAGDDENHTDTQILNQRFRWTTEKNHPVILLSVNSLKREIVDSQYGEVVARHVDFGSYSAGWGGLKFWTSIESCSDGISHRNSFYDFAETIVNINKGETK